MLIRTSYSVLSWSLCQTEPLHAMGVACSAQTVWSTYALLACTVIRTSFAPHGTKIIKEKEKKKQKMAYLQGENSLIYGASSFNSSLTSADRKCWPGSVLLSCSSEYRERLI